MAASYPTNIKSFGTPHVNNTEIVDASHPNAIQDEVVAVESTLGVTPALSTVATASGWVNNGTDFGTVSARLANIEKGIVADTHTQYLKNTGGTVTGTITMSGATITGLPLPSGSTDAASKAYVDAAVTGGVGSVALPASPLLLGGL